jgi:hypothetical protein
MSTGNTGFAGQLEKMPLQACRQAAHQVGTEQSGTAGGPGAELSARPAPPLPAPATAPGIDPVALILRQTSSNFFVNVAEYF